MMNDDVVHELCEAEFSLPNLLMEQKTMISCFALIEVNVRGFRLATNKRSSPFKIERSLSLFPYFLHARS